MTQVVSKVYRCLQSGVWDHSWHLKSGFKGGENVGLVVEEKEHLVIKQALHADSIPAT